MASKNLPSTELPMVPNTTTVSSPNFHCYRDSFDGLFYWQWGDCELASNKCLIYPHPAAVNQVKKCWEMLGPWISNGKGVTIHKASDLYIWPFTRALFRVNWVSWCWWTRLWILEAFKLPLRSFQPKYKTLQRVFSLTILTNVVNVRANPLPTFWDICLLHSFNQLTVSQL